MSNANPYENPYGPPQGQHQQHQGGYEMHGSQPYAESGKPPPGPPPPPQQQQDWGGKEGGDKFEPKPKFNDLFFALLFLAQFAGFIVIAVLSLQHVAQNSSSQNGGLGGNGGTSLTLDLHTAYLLCFIAAAGLLLSIVLLGIVRAFTRIILEISLLLSVVCSVGYAIYLWIEKYWSGAIVFTLFAIIAVISYFPMRRRIPFSRQVLLLVLRIAGEYKSTYVIALVGTFIQAAYSVLWSFTTVAAYQRFSPGGSNSYQSSGAIIGIVVFLSFSYYFTSEFIKNLFLTTEAGIFGSWYYSMGGKSGSVAWGAFKRASTYSMGSIAFGSLIVALLDMVRAALNLVESQARSEGNMVGYIAACIASFCVGCITWAVEFFNRYAYIEIALYGKPYLAAAKDAWRLLKDRGVTALVNDLLINNIWTFGSFAVGALCSLFAFLYLRLSDVRYIEDSNLTAVVLLYAFVVGFQICHSLGYGCLSSGASTIFVCMAEDPQVLAQKDPELFELIRQTYPHVVQGLHV